MNAAHDITQYPRINTAELAPVTLESLRTLVGVFSRLEASASERVVLNELEGTQSGIGLYAAYAATEALRRSGQARLVIDVFLDTFVHLMDAREDRTSRWLAQVDDLDAMFRIVYAALGGQYDTDDDETYDSLAKKIRALALVHPHVDKEPHWIPELAAEVSAHLLMVSGESHSWAAGEKARKYAMGCFSWAASHMGRTIEARAGYAAAVEFAESFALVGQ